MFEQIINYLNRFLLKKYNKAQICFIMFFIFLNFVLVQKFHFILHVSFNTLLNTNAKAFDQIASFIIAFFIRSSTNFTRENKIKTKRLVISYTFGF